MRRKTMTAASIACGLACALFVGLYLYGVRGSVDEARAEALERYGGEQIEVVVAKRDIYAGETVEESALETKMWVADLLPSDAIVDVADAQGRVASSTILAGEALSEKRFAGETRRLEVPEGMIAVSVPAKDVQAVGGAISSGCKVDMYATGGAATDVLAAGVLVLATSAGSGDEDSGESISWITIAVSPEEAQGIVAAAQKTELYFTLPGEDLAVGEAAGNDAAASEEDAQGSGADEAEAAEGVDASGATGGGKGQSADAGREEQETVSISSLIRQSSGEES